MTFFLCHFFPCIILVSHVFVFHCSSWPSSEGSGKCGTTNWSAQNNEGGLVGISNFWKKSPHETKNLQALVLYKNNLETWWLPTKSKFMDPTGGHGRRPTHLEANASRRAGGLLVVCSGAEQPKPREKTTRSQGKIELPPQWGRDGAPHTHAMAAGQENTAAQDGDPFLEKRTLGWAKSFRIPFFRWSLWHECVCGSCVRDVNGYVGRMWEDASFAIATYDGHVSKTLLICNWCFWLFDNST